MMNNPTQTVLETAGCFHCGLPILPGVDFSAHVFGQPRRMCCHGCQAVAESIIQNGLEEYYHYRTELPKTVDDLVPEELRQLDLYDYPDVQKTFVHIEGNAKEASLILEGITCAACIWLNERHLKQLPGVLDVVFNYGSQRARVKWDDGQIRLSQILAEIRKLGYHAHPFSAQQQDALRQKQRKADFRRLAVAGLSAGQVMMIAVALYAGADQGLEFATGQLLRWFSLVLSMPAMTYAAWPFYKAAWRGITNRRIGMDVPISLGLLTGFAGSIWATLNGGVVYYDTLTMLIFFLLATRYLERNAREKSIEAAENLLRLTPAMATLVENGLMRLVPVADLQTGDTVLVKPGETIAVDGVVIEGHSSTDESLLTGESHPLPKVPGSRVYAGSINYESPLTVRVTSTGEDTMLAGISRLLDRAQAEKPRLAQLADHVAAYFTYILLIAVVAIGATWWFIEPARVLEIVLTVLVVSCPCALSIAAPAAFAAAGSHLVSRGVLLTRGHALETLARVNHMVFDKTGTLTIGHPILVDSVVFTAMAPEDCLRIAASLENISEHPIARSILDAASNLLLEEVTEGLNIPGQGISGKIRGVSYRIGNPALHKGLTLPVLPATYPPASTIIWLSDSRHILAAFILSDSPREHAADMTQGLQQAGLKLSILSGDAAPVVGNVAISLGIKTWEAGLSPEQKLASLRDMQAAGDIIAMVGDGINDAPVLAGAQVSIAMGGGTQMARASGDIILLTEKLPEIVHALKTSRMAISIIRQNFAWGLVYNLVALPFAAAGLLSPWMAAIGMSVSSLVVVLNALRLR
jgi:Cu2+-exporting ATPase